MTAPQTSQTGDSGGRGNKWRSVAQRKKKSHVKFDRSVADDSIAVSALVHVDI